MLIKKDVQSSKIIYIVNKILDITNLATNTNFNAKMNEVKNKVPDITNLTTTAALNANIMLLLLLNATTTAADAAAPTTTTTTTTTTLTAVKNEMFNVSNLVQKTDYNTKTNEIENKITTDHDYDEYITTQEFH